MAFQITEAFVQQYTGNVIHLSQQRGSLLRDTVRIKPGLTGEAFFFERIGVTEAVEITTTHQATPVIDIPHSKRRVTPRKFAWPTLVDDVQKLQTLIDPMSEYSLSGGFALGRQIDRQIISAALGNAYSGKSGATAVALPAGQKIAHASAGLTKAKLLKANEIFLKNRVSPQEKRYCLVTAKQVTDLLGITEVSNRDYNSVLPLQEGQVAHWMGFDFIPIELLGQDTDSNRQVICYTESAIGLGLWKDIDTDIGPRRDLTNTMQILLTFFLDATRVEEEKVIEIACVES